MSWREFVASLVDSLAWPLGVAGVLVLFREKIRALLKVKAGSVEGEWGPQGEKIEAQVSGAAAGALPAEVPTPKTERPRPTADPPNHRDTIVRGYFGVLNLVETQLVRSGVKELPPTTPGLIRLARERGAISEKSADAIEGMGHLVELAEYQPVTKEQADEFTSWVAALMYSIRQDAERAASSKA